MQNWQKLLKGDPLPWLLDPENPSVRYWTLVDILECLTNDQEVQETQAAIMRQPLVKELFALQHPEGYWGEDETKPYTAQGAVAVLSLLHMLGVPPNERTTAGCDSFLKFCQHESGGFSLTKKLRSGIFPCTTGEHLPFLVYFGLGNEPRVKAAFTFLIESMFTEDALNCGRYQHQDCLWGAIAALNGLAVLPADLCSEQTKEVVKRLANTLLIARYDFDGEHKRWLTFGVPRAWDLLSALKALAAHGYAPDCRFAILLELILNKQDEQGRWSCGSGSRTWPIERRNQPSKWITLNVLRVLKQAGEVCEQLLG
ncbi:MAG: hypothetical protein EHM41_02905 [Chloroflexi bacterium]|nr:MAG: hypothetical protein EHM41_02905 [Chloroflexota bacterium]